MTAADIGNPAYWYERGDIESILELQRAFGVPNVAVINAVGSNNVSLNTQIPRRYADLSNLTDQTNLVYKVVTSSETNIARAASPAHLQANIQSDVNRFLNSTTRRPCTFAFGMHVGNHWIPLVCNSDGEILVVDTLPGGYDSYIKAAIKGAGAALRAHGIEPKKEIWQKINQRDTTSCGRLTTLVLGAIDPNKTLRSQAGRIESQVAYAIDDKRALRTFHQEIVEQHEANQKGVPYIDFNKGDALVNQRLGQRNLHDYRVMNQFNVAAGSDATAFEQAARASFQQKQQRIDAFRVRSRKRWACLSGPVDEARPAVAPAAPPAQNNTRPVYPNPHKVNSSLSAKSLGIDQEDFLRSKITATFFQGTGFDRENFTVASTKAGGNFGIVLYKSYGIPFTNQEVAKISQALAQVGGSVQRNANGTLTLKQFDSSFLNTAQQQYEAEQRAKPKTSLTHASRMVLGVSENDFVSRIEQQVSECKNQAALNYVAQNFELKTTGKGEHFVFQLVKKDGTRPTLQDKRMLEEVLLPVGRVRTRVDDGALFVDRFRLGFLESCQQQKGQSLDRPLSKQVQEPEPARPSIVAYQSPSIRCR